MTSLPSEIHRTDPPVLLSVVTVVKDIIGRRRELAFRNCTDSVAMQTFPGIEHLIVDGNSTDGTVGLLQSLAEKGNIRFVSERDRGICDAMNRGLRLAKGKYVLFLHSDDALTDCRTAERVMKNLLEHDADYAYADAEVYSQDHSQLIRIWEGTLADIPFGVYPCLQTLFCKRSVLEELGGFSEKYLAAANLCICRLADGPWKGIRIPGATTAFHLGGASGFLQKQLARVEQEHIRFLIDECGWNLTEQEAALLYNRKYCGLPGQEAVRLGVKLPKPEWVERYFEHYIAFLKQQQTVQLHQIQKQPEMCKLRLFGILPFCAFPARES